MRLSRKCFTKCALLRVAVVGCIASLSGCVPDACPDEGWIYDKDYGVCVPDYSDAGPGEVVDAGADAAAAMGVPFGASCETHDDCGGGVCLNVPVSVGCTQQACLEGQENEGICPEGWTCFSDPAAEQSACLRPQE